MKNGIVAVGVTGGIASGKSLVMQMLSLKGAVCFSADQAARVITGYNSPVLVELKKSFGEDVLNQDGFLNRSRLAQLIFSSAEAKSETDRIMHPPIFRLLRAQIEGAQDDLPHGSVVAVEVPLLFETGMQGWFDTTLVVGASEERQIARLQSRNGLTRGEAMHRLDAQWPMSKKLALADFLMMNEGSVEDLQLQIEQIWPSLIQVKGIISESTHDFIPL